MKEILSTYTSYNLWANKRIAELLRKNFPLIDKEVKSSFPSLRKTIYHILGAEELWYRRLNGESLSYVPAIDFAGNFACNDSCSEEAVKQILYVSEKISSLVKEKDDNYLQTMCIYKDTRGNPYTQPRWQMLMHCMNHSAFHRGQIITMLRELGITTIPATDLIVYLRETK